MTTIQKTIHAFVAGKVQGVFFRQSTKAKACELGVNGWVKNLDDGRVECVATGDEDSIHALKEWLKIGPLGARVDRLLIEDIEFEEFDEFRLYKKE